MMVAATPFHIRFGFGSQHERPTLADHRSGSDVQSGKQTGGAMALVDVGSPFDLSGQHG
jgi:hypothetical protein